MTLLRPQHSIKCFCFMDEETGKKGAEIYQNFVAHGDGAGFEIPEHSNFLGTLIPRITSGSMFCSMLPLLVFTSCEYSLPPQFSPFCLSFPLCKPLFQSTCMCCTLYSRLLGVGGGGCRRGKDIGVETRYSRANNFKTTSGSSVLFFLFFF